jgi:hypothetical protein
VHLSNNLKRQQLDEERYSQIERENYLLLDKMSYIMTHPQLLDEKYMGAPVTYGKSLNKEFRKRELMRITEENQVIFKPTYCVRVHSGFSSCLILVCHDLFYDQPEIKDWPDLHLYPQQILRRIQLKEPYYSHLEWAEKVPSAALFRSSPFLTHLHFCPHFQSRRDEEYLRNCAEYPIVLTGRDQLTPRSSVTGRTPRLAPLSTRGSGRHDADGAPREQHYDQVQPPQVCAAVRACRGT